MPTMLDGKGFLMNVRVLRAVASLLIIAGLFCLSSFCLSMVAGDTPTGALGAWGNLLFKSFHVAGLYMPVFLLVLGVLNWQKPVSVRTISLLSLGFIPSMLAGLTLRLMFTDVSTSALPALIAERFGLSGAVVVAGALTLVAFGFVVLGPLFMRNPSDKNTNDYGPGNVPPPQGEHPEAQAVRAFRTGVAGLLEQGRTQAVAYPEFRDVEQKPEAAPQTPIHDESLQDDNPVHAPEQAPFTAASHLDREPEEEVPPVADDYLDDIGNDEIAHAVGYHPVRPMFYKHDDKDDELDGSGENAQEDVAVYFSKDGFITDYPPSNKTRWNTVLSDQEVDDAEPVTTTVTEATTPSDSETPSPNLQEPAVVPAAAHLASQEAEFAVVDDAHVEPIASQAETSETAVRVSREVDEEIPTVESVLHNPAIDEASHRLAPQITPHNHQETEAVDDAENDNHVHTELLPPISTQSVRGTLNGVYQVPVTGILDEPENKEYWLIDAETTRAAAVLKDTLSEFGIEAEVTGIRKGPVITMFEILPAPGVKLNRIVNLADNIALRMAAQSVRIVAPIPGKHAVGIEIPNRDRSKVSFAELLAADGFRSPKMEIPVALGKDITGDAQIIDLARTPHLLIAGSTGSGKSVCVNALICSILYRRSPAEVNMILIDPKIVELKFYNDIPHLLTPVITDPRKAFQALQWCLFEMERRYSLLDAMQVRDIKSYNKKIKTRKIATPHLPYLVIVIDEFADLMATSGKELEGTLARLAAMSRAVGIHLVLATQRPSTDVITGLIKANIPSRIAFMVASKIDSRIIIDSMGAEKLLGKGDMLFTSAWDPFPFRLQGAFLSEEEVERVVSYVKTLGKPDYIDDEIFFDAEDEDDVPNAADFDGSDDPLLQQAIDIVVAAKKASASYIQRRLKVGYNRAARMVEQMEEMGIVGPPQGSKPREILRMFAQ